MKRTLPHPIDRQSIEVDIGRGPAAFLGAVQSIANAGGLADHRTFFCDQ
jgi:hypothetical protein